MKNSTIEEKYKIMGKSVGRYSEFLQINNLPYQIIICV
jgi:hypothetical protein